jgi:hypothetical protein
LLQQPGFLDQKLVCANGVEIIPARRSHLQTPFDLLAQPRSLPQGRQQVFARIKLAAFERRSCAPFRRPRVGDRNEQAGIIGGLQ